MPIRQWAASVMMDSVVPTARRRNVPLDPTSLMEMEARKDVIAPAVGFAAMKLACALVSRDTTEPDVSSRQFWKHHMVAARKLLVLGEKGSGLLFPVKTTFNTANAWYM
mmetsp:Transcript_32250/g.41667  ORF Transcript_32250/g.41667 Transcript_32250/m.41667 type:complete len:109 (-) Transcript_32250:64-390(-)